MKLLTMFRVYVHDGMRCPVLRAQHLVLGSKVSCDVLTPDVADTMRVTLTINEYLSLPEAVFTLTEDV